MLSSNSRPFQEVVHNLGPAPRISRDVAYDVAENIDKFRIELSDRQFSVNSDAFSLPDLVSSRTILPILLMCRSDRFGSF